MRKKIVISVMFVPSLLALLAGCGGSASGNPATGKLQPSDVRPALRTLPYDIVVRRVTGPKGNVASFRGRAHGPHNATLEFSIGIGNPPKALPVRGAGAGHVVWEEAFGYVYNDNGLPSNFRNTAQWHAAARIGVDVEEQLCKAASGKPCPI